MKPVWTGLGNVTGPRDNKLLEGCVGAFVWIGAQAESELALRSRVDRAFQSEGLTVLELEHVREVTNPDEETEEIAYIFEAAANDALLTAHDEFHLYKNQDA